MGIDSAHNTVAVKRRRPQHYLGSDMPRRLQGTLLTCPVGPTGVQGTVLGIAVDLSVLLYLLCPFPGPHERASPVGWFQPTLIVPVEEEL